jgi:hypothetical protein
MRPQALVSYWYHRGTNLAEYRSSSPQGLDLFADSGGYSAYASGAVIKAAEYAAWLKDWPGMFSVAANLDVIGDHEASRRNQHELERRGVQVMPVFHAGEPWAELDALCRDYRYIALGGMAQLRSKRSALGAWLLRGLRVAREHGTRVHAFGVTSPNLLHHLPFYSVDSSTFTVSIRTPLVTLWDPRTMRLVRVHYRELAAVAAHARLLRDYGLPAHRVLDPGFRTKGRLGPDRNRLIVASARSFAAWGQFLTARHRVPAPDGYAGPPVPGTKLYLAAVDHEELGLIIDASLPVPATFPPPAPQEEIAS